MNSDRNDFEPKKLINIYELDDAIDELREAQSESAINTLLTRIKMLVEPGFEESCEDTPLVYDSHPLFSAVLTGNLELIKILVEAGANVNVVEEDDFGTPLFYAKKFCYTEIVEYLEPLTNEFLKEMAEKLLEHEHD